jgi:hypothetical protein
VGRAPGWLGSLAQERSLARALPMASSPVHTARSRSALRLAQPRQLAPLRRAHRRRTTSSAIATASAGTRSSSSASTPPNAKPTASRWPRSAPASANLPGFTAVCRVSRANIGAATKMASRQSAKASATRSRKPRCSAWSRTRSTDTSLHNAALARSRIRGSASFIAARSRLGRSSGRFGSQRIISSTAS